MTETKGSNENLMLRGIEEAKTDCARKHFATISYNNIKYAVVENYEDLMKIVEE